MRPEVIVLKFLVKAWWSHVRMNFAAWLYRKATQIGEAAQKDIGLSIVPRKRMLVSTKEIKWLH